MKEYPSEFLDKAIDEWINYTTAGRNAARNRMFLKWKLIDGLSFQEMANKLAADDTLPPHYKLEPRQLSRIILKNEKILFSHI